MNCHTLSRFIVVGLMMMGAFAIDTLFLPPVMVLAQDRVVLRREGLSGRITISGSVDDCTGSELKIRSGDGTVRTYPAGDVVGIETPLTEPHDRGLKFLADNDVDSALREFDLALRKESRTWVRREILALQVRCGLRRGDYALAGARYLAILKSDPESRHFGLIPLEWAPESNRAGALNEARQWLSTTSEPAQLIGASLLFDDPQSSAAARTTLRTLSTSTDRRIQVLAQFQAWRADVAANAVNELQLVRWQNRVDELPSALRAGPSYLLGRAYAGRHDFELAAAAYLWLPLVDDHDYRLTARATLEAGIALKRIGQQFESQSLFREITRRLQPRQPRMRQVRSSRQLATLSLGKIKGTPPSINSGPDK